MDLIKAFHKEAKIKMYVCMYACMYVMAFPVVEFSRQGYKIRKVFG